MMIQVFVRQRFSVRKRRGDRNGFAFREPTLGNAKRELGRWRAADLAAGDGVTSFVQAEFYDHEAFQADPVNAKAFLVIKA
jgi:hypothetical protein